MEVRSFNQIQNEMRNYISSHQDKLTDFNDGSVLESQVEATARQLGMLYIRCRVGFSTFLRGLPYSIFGFEVKEGTTASTKVVFSRSKEFSYATQIPIGSTVEAAGLRFLTTELSSVLAGEKDSPEISVVSEGVGEKYNVSAGAIKTIVSTLPSDIVSVNNLGAATGGLNREDWGSYIDRFADYIIGLQRTNNSGILSGLNSEHLIRSMSIDEHFPPLEGLWNMTIYLEDGSGGMTTEALAEAKSIIDGNMLENIGGYRAPGVNIRYLTPENVPITLRVTVAAERDIVNEVDESVIANEVALTIRKYINSLHIGKSVLISDLIVIVKRMASISNVKIISPLNDMIISPIQIARYEDCIVTVET